MYFVWADLDGTVRIGVQGRHGGREGIIKMDILFL